MVSLVFRATSFHDNINGSHLERQIPILPLKMAAIAIKKMRLFIDCVQTMFFHRFGPRFPAMTNPYDGHLRQLARETAKELNMESFMREGVYVHLAGPSYETPFESRFLKMIGCDAVGMSTAPEVVVAKHCGMAVLGKGVGQFHQRLRNGCTG